MRDTFPHRFSTKWQDNNTLLYDYGYRWYWPEIGRWMNRDPIGEEGGVNLYLGCGNRTICEFDVLGLATLENVQRLLESVLSAKRQCSCCDAVMEYLLCMECGIVGSNEKILKAIDTIRETIESMNDRVKKTGQALKAIVIIQNIFNINIVDSARIEALSNRFSYLEKIVSTASLTADIGSSISRGDALDLLLSVGSHFSPQSVDSMIDFYRQAYNEAVKMIADIDYSESSIGKIKSAAELCAGAGDFGCEAAELALSSVYQDQWGCFRKVRTQK